MRTIFAVATLLVAGLSGCATTRPVTGHMEKSSETFSGSISGSGYREGKGELSLVSSRKATCKGPFVYTSRRRGEGVLNCDDGRSGPFHIAAVNADGSGYGDLAGQRFTFTFQAEQ
jgi:hypothetical protein